MWGTAILNRLKILPRINLNILVKLSRAFLGLFLSLGYTRRFPVEIFKGKRIAVVGPASSAYNTGKGEFIDSFDYVIRINKAPYLIKEGKFAADIGTRTDILFHSFFENEFSGGGALNFSLYDSLGIKYIVNPRPGYAGWRVRFNFFKKYLAARKIYTLKRRPFHEMKIHFGTYEPTTGLCAIKCVIEAEYSELYITGFTFFKTSYGEGYRDSMKEVEKTREYISKMKIHDPDLEFEEFKRILGENKQKNILLDQALQEIIRNES